MTQNRLEIKLCVAIAGLFFALLIAVGHIQITSQRATITSERIDKYKSVSSALSTAYEQLARTNDRASYAKITHTLMEADNEVSYVVVADSSGHVVFLDSRRFNQEQSRSLEGKGIETVLRAMCRPGVSFEDEYAPISMRAIIGPNKVGSINIGLSRPSIDAQLSDAQSRLIAIFAMMFLMAIVSTILLTKALVNPVKQLTSGVKSVMGGNLEVKVPISTDDEIGELASHFNKMVDSLRDSHSTLLQRANTDSLTRLFNHRYFHEALGKEVERSARYKRTFTVIMMDIDHFKTLNDVHGHLFGDAVLQEVSNILVQGARRIDVVSRYGGEEFAIVLPETDIKGAMHAAERLRASIEKHCFTESDGSCVPVTVSLGIAEFPTHATDCEGMITAADIAMYHSKASGRNQTTTFNDEIFNNREEGQADTYKLYMLLRSDDISTIEAMAAAIDVKSQRYHGFTTAVAENCAAVAAKLKFSDEEQQNMRIAGLLYDIGKLGIPTNILTKPDTLTEQEMCLVRSHPALGYAVAQKSVTLRPILPSILHHHESWDGTGYPNSLKGDAIPLTARIITIADAYQAIISDRPFSQASSKQAAIDELRRCAGIQFDPSLVEIFISVVESIDVKAEQLA